MAITKSGGRQWPLVARVDFTFADLVSGAAAPAVELPGGATVLSGEVYIETAFNSATSDSLTVGDTAGAATYLGATSIAATGRTALVPVGSAYTAPDDLSVTWTGVGAAPTTGAGTLTVTYVIDGRSNENS